MRHRAVPRALLAALAGACLLLPGASAGEPFVLSNALVPLVDTLDIPLPGGGTEPVLFTGTLHVVTRVVPPNPTHPTDPCRLDVLANVQDVTGTGASGRRYRLVGGGGAVA